MDAIKYTLTDKNLSSKNILNNNGSYLNLSTEKDALQNLDNFL